MNFWEISEEFVALLLVGYSFARFAYLVVILLFQILRRNSKHALESVKRVKK